MVDRCNSTNIYGKCSSRVNRVSGNGTARQNSWRRAPSKRAHTHTRIQIQAELGALHIHEYTGRQDSIGSVHQDSIRLIDMCQICLLHHYSTAKFSVRTSPLRVTGPTIVYKTQLYINENTYVLAFSINAHLPIGHSSPIDNIRKFLVLEKSIIRWILGSKRMCKNFCFFFSFLRNWFYDSWSQRFSFLWNKFSNRREFCNSKKNRLQYRKLIGKMMNFFFR